MELNIKFKRETLINTHWRRNFYSFKATCQRSVPQPKARRGKPGVQSKGWQQVTVEWKVWWRVNTEQHNSHRTVFISFNVYFSFERESASEVGAEREGDRIQSRLQALRCQHRARWEAPTHHREIRTRTKVRLNLLSHTGAPRPPEQLCVSHSSVHHRHWPPRLLLH